MTLTLMRFVSAVLLLAPELGIAQRVSFTLPERIEASEGHVLIDWAPPNGAEIPEYELQVTRPGALAPTIVYTGPDTASFRSGLANGEHTYRVRRRDPGAPWSDPLVVAVDYPSLRATAFWMALGLMVFAATVITLFVGVRRTGERHG